MMLPAGSGQPAFRTRAEVPDPASAADAAVFQGDPGQGDRLNGAASGFGARVL